MARVEDLFAGLDAPRALPAELAHRLESAIVFATVEVTEENLATIIDRPKAIPERLRRRIEALLVRSEPSTGAAPRLWWQIAGAGVAAAVVLIAMLALPIKHKTSSPHGTIGALPTITATTPGTQSVTPAQPNQTPSVKGEHFVKPEPVTAPGHSKGRAGGTSFAGTFGGQNAIAEPESGNAAARTRASAPRQGENTQVDLLSSLTNILFRLLGLKPGSLLATPAPASPAPKPAAPVAASRPAPVHRAQAKPAPAKTAAKVPAGTKPKQTTLLSPVTNLVSGLVSGLAPVTSGLLG